MDSRFMREQDKLTWGTKGLDINSQKLTFKENKYIVVNVS